MPLKEINNEVVDWPLRELWVVQTHQWVLLGERVYNHSWAPLPQNPAVYTTQLYIVLIEPAHHLYLSLNIVKLHLPLSLSCNIIGWLLNAKLNSCYLYSLSSVLWGLILNTVICGQIYAIQVLTFPLILHAKPLVIGDRTRGILALWFVLPTTVLGLFGYAMCSSGKAYSFMIINRGSENMSCNLISASNRTSKYFRYVLLSMICYETWVCLS